MHIDTRRWCWSRVGLLGAGGVQGTWKQVISARCEYLFISYGFQAANVPVDFETFFFSEINPVLSSKLEDVATSIRKNKICLKVRIGWRQPIAESMKIQYFLLLIYV